MVTYLKKVVTFTYLPEEIKGHTMSPASDHMFKVRSDEM